MSGDPIDLDAIEARATRAGQSWALDPYGHLTTLVGYDVPALVAEVRRLRATNARLNRRCQIAEAAINELTTTTGRGRARPVAAEVWERCQRSHDNAHHPADATEAQ